MKKRIVNNLGYILVDVCGHPRADKKGAYQGYVYEHILVAERNLGRVIYPKEDVHHLDQDRVNNRPSNLIVLLPSEHAKLHIWLRQLKLGEAERYSYKDNASDLFLSHCPRCKVCQWPMDSEKNTHCSLQCKTKAQVSADELLRSRLAKLMKRKVSWTTIGPKFGLSDNGARKLARRLGLL